MRVVLTNSGGESATVDGLGVIPSATEEGPGYVEVTDEAAEQFKHARGLTLAQVRLPENVELIVIVDDVKREE